MSLKNFLVNLSKTNIDLSVIYDIGACIGTWSEDISSILPNSKFICFEANNNYIPHIKNKGFQCYEVALSNPGRKSIDFFNGNNTGDSYYKETTEWYKNQDSITINCKTLDNMVEQHNLPYPNFIKIDTQGSELDILSGASFLNRVDLVYTECPIICYNKGAPTIQEYIDFFKRRNFIPIDIFQIHRAEETLLQIDIMFMQKSAKEKYLQPNLNINPLL